ncbi:MAG: Rieske 2Fe-2S domain-containing protein [Candidatus Caldarchaeales archaeon]|nr:Rieske 2Fe-2S domain-containing protein [Candidatus Caldarchaeales archaeon]
MRRICNLRDIPEGGMTKIDLGEKQVLVAKVGGRVYVADHLCTHEEADLSLGILEGDVVRCPLHGARFRISDGGVVEGPEGEPPESIPPLRTYKAVIVGDEVYLAE